MFKVKNTPLKGKMFIQAVYDIEIQSSVFLCKKVLAFSFLVSFNHYHSMFQMNFLKFVPTLIR